MIILRCPRGLVVESAVGKDRVDDIVAGSGPGDIDGDGIVGIVDFLMLLANWTA